MKTVNQSYTPFGHEWKSAVKIMPKEHIINLFAEACIERDERIKALEEALTAYIKFHNSLYDSGYINHMVGKPLIIDAKKLLGLTQ